MSILIWLPAIIVLVVIVPRVFIRLSPQFGGRFTTSEKSKFVRSEHWNGEVFENLSPVQMDVNLRTIPGLIKKRLTNKNATKPKKPLPVKKFDQIAWNDDPGKPKFIWYGHATLLLQVGGKNLLIDPMFGPAPSPIAAFGTKRFSPGTLALIEKLPPIDAVLISHDHYDHLDHQSILKLKGRIDKWFVALGVGRHLERWGVNSGQITELDWWQEVEFNDIRITFTPSQHFAGRGLSDRFKSFWGGFVFQTAHHKIYWSGDGGYGDHFKTVGEKLGPFDWAFMECGQYFEMWRQLHLFPEESVQAAIDAGVRLAVPVHWGAFALAMHAWKEPVERFTNAAKEQGLDYCTPELGEIVVMGKEPQADDWWRMLD